MHLVWGEGGTKCGVRGMILLPAFLPVGAVALIHSRKRPSALSGRIIFLTSPPSPNAPHPKPLHSSLHFNALFFTTSDSTPHSEHLPVVFPVRS